jgi:hypothetical membrane protein
MYHFIRSMKRKREVHDQKSALHCNEVLIFKYHCLEGCTMTSSAIQKIGGNSSTLLKVLFICGIVSSLLYFSMDIVAGLLTEGYSFTSQAISELSAIGAPTRPMWVPLGFVYSALLIAFAVGVWVVAGGQRRRALRVIAGLLIAIAVLGSLPFPMHMRGDEKTFTDTMHVVIYGLIDPPLLMLSIGLGAFAFKGKKRWFRLYSIGTLVTFLAVGTLTGLSAVQIEAQQATPWLGVTERILVHGSMLWIAVLAIVLLREEIARSAMMLQA